MKQDPNDVNRRLGPYVFFLILGSIGSVMNTIKLYTYMSVLGAVVKGLWVCDFRLL